MTCGRFASAMACAIVSTPPTSVAVRTPMPAPSASNCCEIWMASSRVGESTSAKKGAGFSSSCCRMGSAKAPVFPEPVCARPITSLPAPRGSAAERATPEEAYTPASASGTACSWISVGAFQPRARQASASSAQMPRATNASAILARHLVCPIIPRPAVPPAGRGAGAAGGAAREPSIRLSQPFLSPDSLSHAPRLAVLPLCSLHVSIAGRTVVRPSLLSSLPPTQRLRHNSSA